MAKQREKGAVAKRDEKENLPDRAHVMGLDGRPYDKTAYIERARLYVQRSIQDILEVGKTLLTIREIEGHGEFSRICEEEIGIPRRTAYRFMNSALKALKHPALDLCQLAQKSKVYALLEAPEEDLKELEEKGILAGHDMDDLAMMSHKELRELVEKLQNGGYQEEEKKKLEREVKDLKRHAARLQAQIPERLDSDWAQDRLAEIETAFEGLEELLRGFMMDERMLEPDREDVQAAAEGIFQRLRARLEMLAVKWNGFTGQA